MLYGLLCLAALTVCLEALLHIVRYHTARLYNWNGSRYSYLGRVGVYRNGERMADLSYTTRYRICLSGYFVRKNRYADMELRAGRARSLLHVDRDMEQSVYYR